MVITVGVIEPLIETQRALGYVCSYFQELFSVLENKKHKKFDWQRRCIFIFCVFCFLKNHFFKNNKKMFSLFFHYSNNKLFFVFFLPFLFLSFLNCFLYFHKGELHSTTTLSPMNPFFFLKLLKLIYLYIVIKSSFV